jgi:hypothetical protein
MMHRSYVRTKIEKHLASLLERREAVQIQYERLKSSKRLLDLDRAIELESKLLNQLFRLDNEIERTELELQS